MQRWVRAGVAVALALAAAAPAFGLGSSSGKEVISPAVDFHATLTDRDGTATGPGETIGPLLSGAGVELIMRCDAAAPKIGVFQMPTRDEIRQQLPQCGAVPTKIPHVEVANIRNAFGIAKPLDAGTDERASPESGTHAAFRDQPPPDTA